MIVIEQNSDSCGAYAPDLPGCIAAADSEQEVMRLIEEAIAFHLEGLKVMVGFCKYAPYILTRLSD